jgi:predicted nucleic acid-binding protein
MVFLQALANDQGPAFACQRLVDEGKLKLFVSPAILEEVKDIANRPRLQRKFKNLTPENVEAFLEALHHASTGQKVKGSTINRMKMSARGP